MDIEQIVDIVQRDAEVGVLAWFPVESGAESRLEILDAGRMGDSNRYAVQWQHRGHNNGRRDPMLALARSEQVVEVHGVTLVEDVDGPEPLLQRYVDWAGVFDQLGLALIGRVVVSEHPGHIG